MGSHGRTTRQHFLDCMHPKPARIPGSVCGWLPVRHAHSQMLRDHVCLWLLLRAAEGQKHPWAGRQSPPKPPSLPPQAPPANPHPPTYPSEPGRVLCLDFPAVRASGDELVLNDPWSTRFFAAGWVASGSVPLSEYNATHMERLLRDSSGVGATALRWNTFLKGLDFEWGEPVPNMPRDPYAGAPQLVKGLKPGCLEAVRDAANRAAKHGMLLQLVLSTAHFLRFGYGGPDFELHGIPNRKRVNNLQVMLSSEAGTAAYIQHVLEPLLNAIGPHPALLGFLVANEGYSMVAKDDKNVPTETDATISLFELQRFINRVAGTIRRRLPGALLSSSLKLKMNSRWDDRTGKVALALWYDDAALLAAGGDPDGTLDLRQYQYYPEGASSIEASPFLNSAAELRAVHKQRVPKPSLVGEFPLEGLVAAQHNPTAMSLKDAYGSLWSGGHTGACACVL